MIIAHKNDEVRILNEMIRVVRKLRGELSSREFACETTFGKIYVSVGDLIEFRKNEKELGVTNGAHGVLIEADPEKFVVSIREDDKGPRTVVFNPQDITLPTGYASTYYRSQGKTIDRAYVLHSPALNKRMFYVGLTRHVDEVYYFISKEQAYCLSDLKRQAIRDDPRENTVNFQLLKDAQSKHLEDLKSQKIQDLKTSDSFLNRVRGYGLSAYDLVKTKLFAAAGQIQDRSPSREFFTLKSENAAGLAAVEEMRVDLEEEPGQRVASPVQQDDFKSAPKGMSPEHQNSVNQYFSDVSAASSLRSIVDLHAATSNHRLESATYYKEWQIACGKKECICV